LPSAHREVSVFLLLSFNGVEQDVAYLEGDYPSLVFGDLFRSKHLIVSDVSFSIIYIE
jgi:hypothetical protein